MFGWRLQITGLILAATFSLSTLSACSPIQPTPVQPTPTLLPTRLPAVQAFTLTPPLPTASPVPAQPAVMLVIPKEADQLQAKNLDAAISELASGSKLAVIRRETLQPGEIPANARLVILAAPTPNLVQLVQAAPQVQFVTVSGSDLPASANLAVIRTRPEVRAFAAGFAATIIASDWRSLGLFPLDDPDSQLLRTAFLNGGRYFCGRCAPTNPPLVLFPLLVSLPAASEASAWQAGYEQIQKNVIQTAYVPARAASPQLLGFLAAKKVILLGEETPPVEVRPNWAVTLRFDPAPALRLLWPEVTAGQVSRTVAAALSFHDINDTLFSVGRQEYINLMIKELGEGKIGVQ